MATASLIPGIMLDGRKQVVRIDTSRPGGDRALVAAAAFMKVSAG